VKKSFVDIFGFLTCHELLGLNFKEHNMHTLMDNVKLTDIFKAGKNSACKRDMLVLALKELQNLICQSDQ
jgi:hypothetical protein